MSATTRICAADGCENPVPERTGRGRRFVYCSVSCRPTQQRTNPLGSLVVEIDHAEVTDNARPAGRIWSVRLRRGTRIVTVAEGLGRPSADHLVAQINELISAPSRAKGGAIE
jgi:hypothetical protein